MNTKTKASVRRKPRAKVVALTPLRAERDKQLWETLTDMQRRGQVKGGMPEYELIAKEMAARGYMALDNKQISQCINRLKTLGYIRESVTFAKQARALSWVQA